MKKGLEQQVTYDQLYRKRLVDPYRDDTPSLTLRRLNERGLLRDRRTLLDVGSGIGKDVRIAVTEHDFSHATGIDTSAQVICDARALSRAKIEPDRIGRIAFVHGDIQKDLQLPLRSYDAVTMTSVVHLMPHNEAVLFLQAAAGLVASENGILAVATKTLASGDIRPVSEGGKSVGLLEKGDGYELHQSDDGLERFYYAPELVSDMIFAASDFLDVSTETLATPYGSVEDCEFVLAVARYS